MSHTDRPALLRWTDALEATDRLDPVVARLRPLADKLLDDPSRRALLHGAPIGHALHPLMTDLPLGLWLSSTTLDLLGGPRAAHGADRLLGLGVLASAPTAVTGLADWALGDRRVQRVGSAHALLNAAAAALYGVSWLQRRRGDRVRGIATSLVAGVVVTASGYLGGHLSVALKSPPRQAADPEAPDVVVDAGPDVPGVDPTGA